MTGNKLSLELVSYSSQYSTSYPATNALDGSTSTYWRTVATYPQSITVKLDNFYTIQGFRVYPGTSSYRVSSFKILESFDGVDFTELYSGNCSSIANYLEFEFTGTILSQYVKIEFTGASTSRLYVYDFELYGTPLSYKYLIRSNSILYTVVDGILSALTDAELTANVFQMHGLGTLPEWAVMSELVNPEFLLWYDTALLRPELTAILTAVPPSQVLESPDYFMADTTVLGIEKVVAVATGSVQFAVSFDSGTSWNTFINGSWAELSENESGMSATTVNSIPTEKWNAIATTGKFRFRVSLMDETSTLTSLIVDYLNEAEIPAEITE